MDRTKFGFNTVFLTFLQCAVDFFRVVAIRNQGLLNRILKAYFHYPVSDGKEWKASLCFIRSSYSNCVGPVPIFAGLIYFPFECILIYYLAVKQGLITSVQVPQ